MIGNIWLSSSCSSIISQWTFLPRHRCKRNCKKNFLFYVQRIKRLKIFIFTDVEVCTERPRWIAEEIFLLVCDFGRISIFDDLPTLFSKDSKQCIVYRQIAVFKSLFFAGKIRGFFFLNTLPLSVKQNKNIDQVLKKKKFLQCSGSVRNNG